MSEANTNIPLVSSAVIKRAGMPTFLNNSLLPCGLVVLLGGFAFFGSNVLSPGNLLNIVQQTSYLALFAIAQTLVMLTRGVDLSLGSAVSMVSVGCALAVALGSAMHMPPFAIVMLGIGAGVLLGAACGLFNGLTISVLGVSPFVASLGSYNIAFGIATTISSGRPVQGIPDEMSTLFYGGSLLGIPAAVLISVIVAAVVHVLLTRTVFGRSLYLLGANPRAAMVAGLPVKRIIVIVYLVSSLLTALGAIMLTARTGSGEPNLGGSLSLQSIAAAVVGGTSLTGARGGIWTALLGALFVTILSNGMNLARIDGNLQMIVLGMVIIAGVVLDRWRSGQMR